VAEYGAGQLQGAPRAFQLAPLFDLADRGEGVDRLDLMNRHLADRVAQQAEQIFAARGCSRCPSPVAVAAPFAAIFVGDAGKGVFRQRARPELFALLL